MSLRNRQVECLSQPQQNADTWGYGPQRLVLPLGSVNLPEPLNGPIDLNGWFPAFEPA
jgi:hypothetical protein